MSINFINNHFKNLRRRTLSSIIRSSLLYPYSICSSSSRTELFSIPVQNLFISSILIDKLIIRLLSKQSKLLSKTNLFCLKCFDINDSINSWQFIYSFPHFINELSKSSSSKHRFANLLYDSNMSCLLILLSLPISCFLNKDIKSQ